MVHGRNLGRFALETILYNGRISTTSEPLLSLDPAVDWLEGEKCILKCCQVHLDVTSTCQMVAASEYGAPLPEAPAEERISVCFTLRTAAENAEC